MRVCVCVEIIISFLYFSSFILTGFYTCVSLHHSLIVLPQLLSPLYTVVVINAEYNKRRMINKRRGGGLKIGTQRGEPLAVARFTSCSAKSLGKTSTYIYIYIYILRRLWYCELNSNCQRILLPKEL